MNMVGLDCATTKVHGEGQENCYSMSPLICKLNAYNSKLIAPSKMGLLWQAWGNKRTTQTKNEIPQALFCNQKLYGTGSYLEFLCQNMAYLVTWPRKNLIHLTMIYFQGRLPNGQMVAIKRLLRDLSQEAIEFKNEVLLLAKL